MFGYGIGISDIRVTFADGRERDCLRKIYPVGRFIAAGFAGSVKIGFAMIERLTELLHSSDESGAWEPLAVAEWWPSDAREVFGRFPEDECRLQSQIMLVSVDPTQHVGNPSWPRSYVHVFTSPNFDAVVAKPREVLAIGCGAAVQPCRNAVERLSCDSDAMFEMMKGEQGVQGGMATLLGWHLTSILKETQPRGISSHLHYCWVYRGRIVIKTNDHQTIGRWTTFTTGVDAPDRTAIEPETRLNRHDAPPAEVFSMPRIATSWQELLDVLTAEGVSAVGLVA